jgi:hypothetical protein
LPTKTLYAFITFCIRSTNCTALGTPAFHYHNNRLVGNHSVIRLVSLSLSLSLRSKHSAWSQAPQSVTFT